jgi:hypothetical protein
LVESATLVTRDPNMSRYQASIMIA